MGLDAVELVMDVEEAFDIQIPDELAGEIRTVGDLYDVIIKLSPSPGIEESRERCLSAATFRLVRDAVRSELSLDAVRLRPRDFVDAVLPRTGRRQVWSRLQARLDMRLPSLVRPSWLTIVATASTVLTGSLVGCWAFRFAGSIAAILWAIAAAVVAGLALMKITEPFAVHTSAPFDSFRSLTKVILAYNYSALCDRFNAQASSPADIWDALCVIIVEQLGVKPETVTRDALFVDDLGMG
jgi:acyl carrier protein